MTFAASGRSRSRRKGRRRRARRGSSLLSTGVRSSARPGRGPAALLLALIAVAEEEASSPPARLGYSCPPSAIRSPSSRRGSAYCCSCGQRVPLGRSDGSGARRRDARSRVLRLLENAETQVAELPPGPETRARPRSARAKTRRPRHLHLPDPQVPTRCVWNGRGRTLRRPWRSVAADVNTVESGSWAIRPRDAPGRTLSRDDCPR